MESANIHEKIKELLGILPDKLAIVEEQIPLEVQMTYFELSKKPEQLLALMDSARNRAKNEIILKKIGK